jgi:hypothetical protein
MSLQLLVATALAGMASEQLQAMVLMVALVGMVLLATTISPKEGAERKAMDVEIA